MLARFQPRVVQQQRIVLALGRQRLAAAIAFAAFTALAALATLSAVIRVATAAAAAAVTVTVAALRLTTAAVFRRKHARERRVVVLPRHGRERHERGRRRRR